MVSMDGFVMSLMSAGRGVGEGGRAASLGIDVALLRGESNAMVLGTRGFLNASPYPKAEYCLEGRATGTVRWIVRGGSSAINHT